MNEGRVAAFVDREFAGEWGAEASGSGLVECYVLRATNFTGSGLDYTTAARRFVPKKKAVAKALRPGDLVLESAGGGPGVPVGRVALFAPPDERTYLVSNFFRTLRLTEDADPGYVRFALDLLHRQPLIWAVQQQTTGIINLKIKDYLELPVRVPPLEEQRRIAEVLDTIDETIQASERVIAKLEANRSGLMHHSFGGRTWRSDLSTDSLGSLLLRSPKNGRSPVEAASWQGAYMLGLGCLSRTGFVPNQLKFAPPLDVSLTSALLNDGDLLMSRSNTRDRVGYVGTFRDVGSRCIYPDLMMRLVPRDDVNSRYLELALQSAPGRRQIEATASGTSGSMVKITGSEVARLSVPIVPLPEQLDVSQRIDAQDSSIAREKEVLEKTRQTRAGLASDLLFGRVRTVAA